MSDVYRQSALLLHGLNEADRHWILAQLDTEQNGQLRSHLDELNQMGMVENRSLVEGLLSRIKGKSVDSAERVGNALRHARPDVVLHMLSNEPTWLIASVLSIEAWPWREAIYVGLDVSKRDRVKQALRGHMPVKLGYALIAQLEERLPEATLEAGHSSAEVSGLARIRQQIKNRLGV